MRLLRGEFRRMHLHLGSGKETWKQAHKYPKKNLIRHNLDVMHVEKNVFDNIFNTVMDDKDKTKDNVKSRQDVKQYCRRHELELFMKANGNKSKPKALYTLNKEQKKVVNHWVKDLKFLDGYASNLSRCIDIEKCKMRGMKSHDCHVFMERLLPIALREMLHEPIWKAMIEGTSLYVFNYRGRPSRTCKRRYLDDDEYDVATFYVLHKCEEIQPFFSLGWKTSNTDICLVGEVGDYYGQMTDVIELEYTSYSKVILFRVELQHLEDDASEEVDVAEEDEELEEEKEEEEVEYEDDSEEDDKAKEKDEWQDNFSDDDKDF
ncbi:hypothetical protein Tco_1158161 [Tanacetum coccineum]